MGLDMYAFQVIKPSLDPEKVYIRRELLGEYVVLPPDEAASNRYLRIALYVQKLRVISRYSIWRRSASKAAKAHSNNLSSHIQKSVI